MLAEIHGESLQPLCYIVHVAALGRTAKPMIFYPHAGTDTLGLGVSISGWTGTSASPGTIGSES
jgi:hypothetical protein